MGFDASKLVVGQKYPTRGGGKAEFLRSVNCNQENRKLLWILHELDGHEMVFETGRNGLCIDSSNPKCFDVTADQPVTEPVEHRPSRRFVAVLSERGHDWLAGQYETLELARNSVRALGHCVGIYELPATILVHPK